MRRPPLTRKKIRVILDSLQLMGGCAGVEDPDFVQEGCRTEQDIKDYHEAVNFMRQLSRWHNWKQEQKVKSVETSPSLDDLSDEQLDQVMSSVGMHIKRKNENEKTQMDS